MIVFNQSLLIFKSMIQHLAIQGMLYVEKMTHEVGGPGIGIRTFHELIDLLFSVRHPAMRLLDQDAF
jgi:hypothetical protein